MAEGNRLPALENAPHLKTDGEFFRIPPSPFSQRELHFLPKPLFLRKQGCNRPLVLGTASLYGWRGIKALAMLCGMGLPYYSSLIRTALLQLADWGGSKHPTPMTIQLHPQCLLGIQSILRNWIFLIEPHFQ